MISLIGILVFVSVFLPKTSTFRFFIASGSKFLNPNLCINSRNTLCTRTEFKLLISKSTSVHNISTAELSDEKNLALELLDSITSPTDSSDPLYDVEKDIRRDNLLLTNDYHDLKLEMKERGLPTGGDKLVMITRMLLHIIDPSLDYNKL